MRFKVGDKVKWKKDSFIEYVDRFSWIKDIWDIEDVGVVCQIVEGSNCSSHKLGKFYDYCIFREEDEFNKYRDLVYVFEEDLDFVMGQMLLPLKWNKKARRRG